MATTSAAVAGALAPNPTSNYRSATTSGPATNLTPAKPTTTPRSASVAGSTSEGLLAPPIQRAARLSLPPRLEPPSPTSSPRRPSLQPPPPPVSTALRRRTTIIFYSIVAQFFLSIGCLFCAIAIGIILFSFDLYCLFGRISLTASLALAAFTFLAVIAQIVDSSLGIGAFNGKAQGEVKAYLLIVYLTVNLIFIFLDLGLLFFCAAGGVLSFIYESDCWGETKYYELIALAAFFILLCFCTLLHLLSTIAICMLLCKTSELFTQRDSTTKPPLTPTTIIEEEKMIIAAPPIKRLSQAH